VHPAGRISNSVPLGDEDVLHASLPQPLAATHYERAGNEPLMEDSVVAVLLIVRRRYGKS